METPLAKKLKARIRRDGPITFHEFMDAALYDAEWGYYVRGPAIGPEGDFSTSVSFPAFRASILRLAEAAHDALGRPRAFRIVELGAGTGLLARAILEGWRRGALEYVTVDASPALRARQADVPGVRAVASTRDLAPAPGLTFGNEVVDAFPIHRVVGGTDGSLLEVLVDVDASSAAFRGRLGPARDPALAERFHRVGMWPSRGQVCDVAPGIDAFVRDAARLAEPGFLVLVDYGDPARVLYGSDRLNGTLAAYKAHGRFHDPYDDVGERDLTADVDFTAVDLAAREAGLEPLGLVSQERFLEALGIHDLGLPDEARIVAGAAGLGSAFHVAAFRRGTSETLPGF